MDKSTRIKELLRNLGKQLGFKTAEEIDKTFLSLYFPEEYTPRVDFLWYIDLKTLGIDTEALAHYLKIKDPEAFSNFPFAAFEIEGSDTTTKAMETDFANLTTLGTPFGALVVDINANKAKDLYRRGNRALRTFQHLYGRQNFLCLDKSQVEKLIKEDWEGQEEVISYQTHPSKGTGGEKVWSKFVRRKWVQKGKSFGFIVKEDWISNELKVSYDRIKERTDEQTPFSEYSWEPNGEKKSFRGWSTYFTGSKIDLIWALPYPSKFRSFLDRVQNLDTDFRTHAPLHKTSEQLHPLFGFEIESSSGKHAAGGIVNLAKHSTIGNILVPDKYHEKRLHGKIHTYERALGVKNVEVRIPRTELSICLWLPKYRDNMLSDEQKGQVMEENPDILVIPEGHDRWENNDKWKQFAKECGIAIYAGFRTDERQLGLFYEPESGNSTVYQKHSTAPKIAFEEDDWSPEKFIKTVEYKGVEIGLTICHDHYISSIMRAEALQGADILLNISGNAVKRNKWGEMLQARAIENGSWVFSTMHQLNPGGDKSWTNKAHVFAFDPSGDLAKVTRLSPEEKKDLFETKPDNLYIVDVDLKKTKSPGDIVYAENENKIDRIRKNTFGKVKETPTTLKVKTNKEEVELEYKNETKKATLHQESVIGLQDENFLILTFFKDDILRPEIVSNRLLSAKHIEKSNPLIISLWEDIDQNLVHNVVEPILRARTVEWCIPTILQSNTESRAYQLANTAKSTHQLTQDKEGFFYLEMERNWGLSTALKPAHGEKKHLRELSEYCGSLIE